MPAAAVIPAPIAYIKVVAVKKLVVGFLLVNDGPPFCGEHLTWPQHLLGDYSALYCVVYDPGRLL